MNANYYNPFSLSGKTVLVTGASSGIGRATAVACSRLGAKLVVTGRRAERLQATFDSLEGTGHLQVPADLTSEDDLGGLIARCPVLNGVALCAGIGMTLPFPLCSRDRVAEVMDANFTAPVELLRLLLKGRRLADGGAVVFVSSVAGLPGGVAAGNALYAASKTACDAVLRHLVREYGSRGIRFNSVNPGRVNTPSVRKCNEKLTDGQIAADIARYPLRRYGEPDDVAHGIVYLLSDASSWVTGHRLAIDGGLTC